MLNVNLEGLDVVDLDPIWLKAFGTGEMDSILSSLSTDQHALLPKLRRVGWEHEQVFDPRTTSDCIVIDDCTSAHSLASPPQSPPCSPPHSQTNDLDIPGITSILQSKAPLSACYASNMDLFQQILTSAQNDRSCLQFIEERLLSLQKDLSVHIAGLHQSQPLMNSQPGTIADPIVPPRTGPPSCSRTLAGYERILTRRLIDVHGKKGKRSRGLYRGPQKTDIKRRYKLLMGKK